MAIAVPRELPAAEPKYKVPRAALESRLRIFWLNLARVRQLCHSLFGYDPEVWDMDQSPFHMNEAGLTEHIVC